MTMRPTLSDQAAEAQAHAVAGELAAELQRAGETADADLYDNSFATDVLWGTPFGATVIGYDRLNAIHHQLMDRQVAPPSRFEVVAAASPAPGVVVTQIRRQATDPGAFSEMAMYTLIEREGRWWLAAAQNTPIDPTKAALTSGIVPAAAAQQNS
ncbi:SgcJ/EcaC family oxidoreductase [Nocardia transvalensis]|uniref:SgcJ/EcaC family oxidoreductase n=1 Tax=Nocardia transvalensis TaxID=37333 RepID=UPI001894AFEF|nr:SgcJ/EcaC family oxidoreductase [Nocardia transvalensis]MBF6327216.1 SgcJ/EcaC family oxidoreductase [Nocardia transvalensis]